MQTLAEKYQEVFGTVPDPYAGGPTIGNAGQLSAEEIQRADSQGLVAPNVDPINVVAGFGAGALTSGLGTALGMIPGMMASEPIVGTALDAIEDYTGNNPILNTVAGVALPMMAGKYFEPHVNRFASSGAEVGKRALGNDIGMFLGPNAGGADLAKLAEAKQMMQLGLDEKAVWQNTGWFRGDDGKWRFETSDQQLKVTGPKEHFDKMQARSQERMDAAAEGLKNGEITPHEYFLAEKEWKKYLGDAPQFEETSVGDAIDHPTLFDNYPDLAHKPLTFADLGPDVGGTNSSTGVSLNSKLNAPGQLDDIAAHELQHSVQMDEGFAPGGSPDQFKFTDKLSNEWNLRKELLDLSSEKGITPKEAAEFYKGMDEHADMKSYADEIERGLFSPEEITNNAAHYDKLKGDPLDTYHRLHGEAEARMTQKRMDYSPEQRAEMFPYDDLDVPREELLMQGMMGPSESGPQQMMESRLSPENREMMAEPQGGYHLRKNPARPEGITPTPMGAQNTYSNKDVGARIDASVEGNEYSPRAYFYNTQTQPESTVASLNPKTYGVEMPENILDLGKGVPKGLADSQNEYLKSSEGGWGVTDGSVGNAFDNALKEMGFRGLSDPKKGISYSFDNLPATPEMTFNAGISNVVESKGMLPETLSGVKEVQNTEFPKFAKQIEQVFKKSYPELKIKGLSPSLANFPSETSGDIEHSITMQFSGPPDAAMAALSEIGTMNHQRMVFAMGDESLKKSLPDAIEGIRLTGEFEDGLSLDDIQSLLKNLNVSEYNIVDKGAGRFGVDIFDSKSTDFSSLKDKLRFPKQEKVYSAMAGSFGSTHEKIGPSFDDYSQNIRKYHGETKGKSIFDQRAAEGIEWAR
ncbi:MAG: hypothetical protein DRP85_06475 [Candidatus Makaraimicrobium thalassicum]|nr:MAG: hypothetical protein DRP85_06475 [Candidatus Omnitrophota bacterium]